MSKQDKNLRMNKDIYNSLKIIFLIVVMYFTTNYELFSQTKYYEICKIDSSSRRVFIFSTRKYIANLSNATLIIKSIESKFSSFKDLNISFFDNKKHCGYLLENVVTEGDSIVELVTNDVQSHWFAEYSKVDRKLKYYKSDGSLTVSREFIVGKK